jgi:hypothetical protein
LLRARPFSSYYATYCNSSSCRASRLLELVFQALEASFVASAGNFKLGPIASHLIIMIDDWRELFPVFACTNTNSHYHTLYIGPNAKLCASRYYRSSMVWYHTIPYQFLMYLNNMVHKYYVHITIPYDSTYDMVWYNVPYHTAVPYSYVCAYFFITPSA